MTKKKQKEGGPIMIFSCELCRAPCFASELNTIKYSWCSMAVCRLCMPAALAKADK